MAVLMPCGASSRSVAITIRADGELPTTTPTSSMSTSHLFSTQEKYEHDGHEPESTEEDNVLSST